MNKLRKVGLLFVVLLVVFATSIPTNAATKVVTKKKVVIKVGQVYKLKLPKVKTKIKWVSNKSKIASVNKSTGRIKGRHSGKVIITASTNGKKYKFPVTVKYVEIDLDLEDAESVEDDTDPIDVIKSVVAPTEVPIVNVVNKTIEVITVVTPVPTMVSDNNDDGFVDDEDDEDIDETPEPTEIPIPTIEPTVEPTNSPTPTIAPTPYLNRTELDYVMDDEESPIEIQLEVFNANGKDIVWKSSAYTRNYNCLYSVGENGFVTVSTMGKFIVEAIVDGFKLECEITVYNPMIEKLPALIETQYPIYERWKTIDDDLYNTMMEVKSRVGVPASTVKYYTDEYLKYHPTYVYECGIYDGYVDKLALLKLQYNVYKTPIVAH